RYIEDPFADALAAAALRNDYVRLPPPEHQPRASRVFYACVGIEASIRSGEVGFGEAQQVWLPALEAWCAGHAAPGVARRLDAWEREMRAKEDETLATIAAWER